ncbi:MAG TPA: hypothetical protein VFY72_07880, partial [Beijerinckiaceae bacterium]|nr:hypothetical protein [Beijerinckiaceae bacterium]
MTAALAARLIRQQFRPGWRMRPADSAETAPGTDVSGFSKAGSGKRMRAICWNWCPTPDGGSGSGQAWRDAPGGTIIVNEWLIRPVSSGAGRLSLASYKAIPETVATFRESQPGAIGTRTERVRARMSAGRPRPSAPNT